MTRIAIATVLLASLAGPAFAQAPAASGPALVYGVYGGPGHRTTSGTFLASALPSGAAPPASDRTTATLGFEVGVGLTDRLAVMGVWDQTAGGNSGAGHWGSMRLHAVGRVWLTRRWWAEGGGGLSELGYKPPAPTTAAIARVWRPGGEASVGVDVLKGPRVALTVAARYSTATFHGLSVRSLVLQVGLINLR